jgi:AhpD family alkylhydroperoxidase
MKDYPSNLKHIQRSMAKLSSEIPETMQAFSQLHHASASAGVMDAKTKELIALAIAVTVRCDGCVAYHVNDALKAGASRQEIVETLGVAILMGGGPSLMYALEAIDAVDQFTAGN